MTNLMKLMTVLMTDPVTPPTETPPTETPPTETPPTETPPTETPPTETPPTETPPTETPPADPDTPPVEPPVEPSEPQPKITKVEDYKLPDGVPQHVAEFALANNLSQEQLDATIANYDQFSQQVRLADIQAIRDQGDAHVASWGDEAPAKIALAKRALAQNDPEGVLTKALNETGYGNHPAVLDFLYTIGRSMQEGGFLKSDPRKPGGAKTAAQTLYPNHPSKEN